MNDDDMQLEGIARWINDKRNIDTLAHYPVYTA
jgi:hypothetical protein